MMFTNISIIIPVYNVEQYLSRCINSIRNQAFQDYELILIDDGSLDNSGNICDDYAKLDKRIKVFHKYNEGVSEARNLGLAKAKGKYIWFIDADDYIEKDSMSLLIEELEKYELDIIAFDYRSIFESKNKSKYHSISMIQESQVMTGINFMNKCLTSKLFVWSFIYKKELISLCNANFKSVVKYGEDALFNIHVIPFADRVKHVNLCLYNYVQHISSAMNSVTEKRISDTFVLIDKIISSTNKYGMMPYFDRLITSIISNRLLLLSKSEYSIYRKYFFRELEKKKIYSIRPNGNSIMERFTAYLFNFSPGLCLNSFMLVRFLKRKYL